MTSEDIRWVQRFDNYQKALAQLTKFTQQETLNELEAQGLVKAFEYTYELAWNTLKDLLEFQGFVDLIGSRDTLKEGFKQNLLGATEADGLCWMSMIKSRNMTSHAYSEKVVKEITEAILTAYYPAFLAFERRLGALAVKQHD